MDLTGLLSRLLSPELGSAAILVGFAFVLLYLSWQQLDRTHDQGDDLDALRLRLDRCMHDRLRHRWDAREWRRRAYEAGYDGPDDTGWGGTDEPR